MSVTYDASMWQALKRHLAHTRPAMNFYADRLPEGYCWWEEMLESYTRTEVRSVQVTAPTPAHGLMVLRFSQDAAKCYQGCGRMIGARLIERACEVAAEAGVSAIDLLADLSG